MNKILKKKRKRKKETQNKRKMKGDTKKEKKYTYLMEWLLLVSPEIFTCFKNGSREKHKKTEAKKMLKENSGTILSVL